MRLAIVGLASLAALHAADYKLKVSPQTVAWGYYWSEAKPVLTVKSGDIVEVQTVSTSNPTALSRAGVKDEDIQPEFKRLYSEVPREQKGPGGHILTGPIAVEGAEPGDVLEVRIQKIVIDTPYATNGFSPNDKPAGSPGGILGSADFKSRGSKLIWLDLQRNVAKFADNIEIPLAPFFGSMGVAPDPSKGKLDSAPPGQHAGNLDNRYLVAGTTLFIPVHAAGALFEVGDGHAGQGNGEVDITALETSLTGTFQFIVRKDMKLTWPRAETPTHWIAMGTDPDLTEALRIAVRQAIEFLVNEKHMTREDAYALCSVAVDFNVTQAVDGNKGVHAMIPKSIFK